MSPHQDQVDIIVVGGGIAGMASAVRAAELGATVALLEQGEKLDYPCNSRYSGGMFHLAYHDIAMPADQLSRSLRAKAPQDVDHDLVDLIATNALRAVDWLRDAGGARFFRVGPAPYEKWVLSPPRPPKPRLVWPGRGPDRVLRNLAANLSARAMPVRLGHKVTQVSPSNEGGYIVTVSNQGSNAQVLHSKAVVFADGGFQAKKDLLAEFVSPDPDRVLQRNAGTGLGTSISMAETLGADISDTTAFYGHLVGRRALETDELWPYPMIDGLAGAGILVSSDGQRFADEGRGGVYMSNAVARQQNPTESYVIVDDKIWRTVGRLTRVPANPVLCNRGGELFTADTLEELARKAGVDTDGLAMSVATHNKAIKDSSGAELKVVRSGTSAKPIDTAPFHAIPVCAGITYTMGGLRIDGLARVRAKAGGILQGLYAAGSAVGNIEGGQFSFYLGGLCKALVLGLTSGENAALFLREQKANQANSSLKGIS